jgi:glyoxylase-like metal-dependent hydrolase (beta-lactamase superfamily II)
MNNRFYEEANGIYRLRVPFENIYTSVFLITHTDGNILVDVATTAYDVDNYIIPALENLGYKAADVSKLVLTHKHGDHAGGLERFLEYAPEVSIITGEECLQSGIASYPLYGHTEDSVGVLDFRTGTLISGDGLQGAGVDKYRCSLQDRAAYMETLDRVEKDNRIENILFSHAYEPWNVDRAIGRKNILDCISDCRRFAPKEKI